MEVEHNDHQNYLLIKNNRLKIQLICHTMEIEGKDVTNSILEGD